MRVLLCAEGVSDFGAREFNSRRLDHDDREGWLQPLIRRTAALADMEFARRRRGELLSLGGVGRRPRLPGHAEKAFIAARIAAREGFDAVMFMADADSPVPSVWRTKHAQILDGFRKAGVRIASLACVPKSMAESWLLADGGAWHALGLPDRVPLPRDPENLWGPKRDPHGDHPKALFARLCTEAGCAPDRGTHNALAERIDLEVLAKACALSYGAFAADLRRGLAVTPPAAND